MSHLTIEVASVPDRDELVAELWQGSEQVAELSNESGRLVLQVYPPKTGAWEFELSRFEEALAELRRRLLK